MAKDVSPLARKDLPRSPMQTRDEARASRSVFESRAPPRSPLKRSDDATPKSPSRSPMDTSGRPRKSQLPLVLKRDVGGSSANVGPKRKGETDNVRVMVRVRPFGQSEIDAATEEQTYMQSVINMPRHDQVAFLDHAKDYESKQGFNFDSVFWSCTQEKNERVPFSGQQEVYLATGRPALETAWEGINSCIFAYGQTGSGKTHTMMGDPSKITAEGVLDEDSLGLIPRLCRDLFRDIDTWEENAMSTGLTKKSEVEVRFLEIYNEKVKDLLMNARMPDGTRGFQQHLGEYENSKMTEVVDGEDLKVREHPSRGPYVHGATAFKPRSYDDIMSLLAQGNAARHIASTNMNDRSSRSHAMFRITSVRRANINLVDLAGSENVKRSGATGGTLLEAQKINLSLTTLRRVIDALIEQKGGAVVPYRDSTLTWLLKNDLGGNAKTYMLATVSPHYSNALESLRTLEYAMRARSIVNKLQVNEDDTSKILADLEKRIMETQAKMEATQGEASKEQIEDMKVEMEDARQEKMTVEYKLTQAVKEAEEAKRKLKALSEQKVALAFKQAIVLTATRQRLKQTEEKLAMEASQTNALEEMRSTVERHKMLVETLQEEKQQLGSKSEEMRKRESGLARELEKERQRLQSSQSKQREESARIAELSEQVSALLHEKEGEETQLKKHHDNELRAILEESEQMAQTYQQQIEALKCEMQEGKRQHQADMHAAREEAEYRLSVHHRDLEELRQQLHHTEHDATDFKERERCQAEMIQAEKMRAIRSLEDYEDRISALKKEKAAMEGSVEAEHRKYIKACEENDRLRSYLVRLSKKEEQYETVYEDVKSLLDHFQSVDGKMQEGWTMREVKEAVARFNDYKNRFVSNRPNKEKLKQMLRQDPSRRGAERMRELLGVDSNEDPATAKKLVVLMDGLRCPALPPRSPTRQNASHFDPEGFGPTEADQMAYQSDPVCSSPQQVVFQRLPAKIALPGSAKRTTSPGGARRTTSPGAQEYVLCTHTHTHTHTHALALSLSLSLFSLSALLHEHIHHPEGPSFPRRRRFRPQSCTPQEQPGSARRVPRRFPAPEHRRVLTQTSYCDRRHRSCTLDT